MDNRYYMKMEVSTVKSSWKAKSVRISKLGGARRSQLSVAMPLEIQNAS